MIVFFPFVTTLYLLRYEFWLEIEEISKVALQKRILLWDAIEDLLESNSSWSDLRDSKHETYSYSFSEK